mgnify:CR=1 FL=1
MSKYLVIFIICFSILACANKQNNTPASESVPAKSTVDGSVIFKQYCELCHGADGKLGLNGSKDLTVSTLDLDARITQVTKGKGLMMPYEKILSAEEIKAVAEYSMTLK